MIPVSWIPPDRLPAALLVLMPGRYLNFARDDVRRDAHRARSAAAARSGAVLVLLFLTCGLLVGDRSMLWEFLEHHHHVQYQSNIRPLHIVWLGNAALLAGAAWTRRSAECARQSERTRHRTCGTHCTLHLLAACRADDAAPASERSGAHFSDRTNDVFFADVAARLGRAARCRRPAPHSAAHAAAGAPRQRRARHRDVLARNGRRHAAHAARRFTVSTSSIRLPRPWARAAFPRCRTAGPGRATRRKSGARSGATFGVTQVLAYADWALQLPVASQSRRLLLYDIPER